MSNWYYADAERQRQGPVTAEELTQRFHQGRLRLDTLVWRDGLSDWQPLRAFTDELALHKAPAEIFYTPLEASPVDPNPIDASAASVPDAAVAGATPGTVTPAWPSASPYAPQATALNSRQAFDAGDEVVLAGFWKRVAASIIDGILLGVVTLLVLGIGGAALGVGMSSMASDLASGTLGMAFILGLYVIPIAFQAVYFTWMHASIHQATLGKLAVGIKVVQTNGTRISTSRSLGRFAAYFFMHLFSCGITSLVSAFMVGLGERKQGLHDLVADTLVVDRWAYTAHPERQRHELGPVTIAIIILGALLVAIYLVALFAVGVMAGRS